MSSEGFFPILLISLFLLNKLMVKMLYLGKGERLLHHILLEIVRAWNYDVRA